MRDTHPFDPDDATTGIGMPVGGAEGAGAPDKDETGNPDGPPPTNGYHSAIFTPADSVAYRPLRKDLKDAAASLTVPQVRFCVDGYYTWQGDRIASHNQAEALRRSNEPHLAIDYVEAAFKGFEDDMKVMLDHYTKVEETGMGLWSRGIMGVGPVLAAGLIAHLDIEKAQTVGHFWRFAGLDPTVKWLGTKGAAELVDRVLDGSRTIEAEHLAALSEATHRRMEVVERMATDLKTEKYSITTLKKSLARRPWNASLKVLCWKLGESFVKVANYERDYYGKKIVQRKAYEAEKNANGEYREQAEAKLRDFNIGKETTAYKFYAVGQLPPGHIHARAKRWAVKLFLSHWHGEAYRRHFKQEPPAPYPIAFLGHAHYMPAPVSS